MRLAEPVRGLKVGDPMDKSTPMGPVVSAHQLETLLGYVDAGKREAAALVAGGQRARVGDGRGYFVQPTVFANVTNRMRITREGIFGPVLPVMPFPDADDVVTLGNDTFYGLTTAVRTRDVGKALRIAHALPAGTVWVNVYNLLYDAALLFGAFEKSGFGRELGQAGLGLYAEVKSVWVGPG